MIAAIPCHTSKRTTKKLLNKIIYMKEYLPEEDSAIDYKPPVMTIGTEKRVHPYQQKCYINKIKK